MSLLLNMNYPARLLPKPNYKKIKWSDDFRFKTLQIIIYKKTIKPYRFI
jgi:hypothetical protein